MSKIPSMKKDLVRFRSQTSSDSYNELQENIFYDMTELFNMANQLDQELETANNTLVLSNRFQQLRILSLENQVAQLRKDLAEALSLTGEHLSYAFIESMKPSASLPGGASTCWRCRPPH